jgi:ABC-type uncharacterized transport system permease subunit
MSDITTTPPTKVANPPVKEPGSAGRSSIARLWDGLKLPLLAMIAAFVIGGIVIWITSGFSISPVLSAYGGLVRGAFIKQRGFSESLVATTPYILLALGVGLGFKSGLFNIGVEGQFYIGAICSVWVGFSLKGLPAIIHLPLAVLGGALGGAIWAGVPGYLKARTGAHEVITTMMMNYVAFRLDEYLISFPLRDPSGTTVQTPPISKAAELWPFAEIPERLSDPLNALGLALIFVFVGFIVGRWLFNRPTFIKRLGEPRRKQWALVGFSVAVGVVAFFVIPLLTKLWWPFNDPYDRLHIGFLLALAMAVVVWWLLWRTTLGFELRMVGANPNAGRYAGVNITRNIVVAMAISGGLAGMAGTIEVLGVSICRCMPLFFSSGYGFDSIAIALLAKNNPFGIILASFLFGAMRNGADLMELSSGVSKYIISLIQALLLLFVAAPPIIRWMFRLKAPKRGEEEAIGLRGWGG